MENISHYFHSKRSSRITLRLAFFDDKRLIGSRLISETSRISSRGKGSVYSKGGGSRTLSKRFLNGNIITFDRSNHSLRATCELTTPTSYSGFLRGTSNGQAACMIIEEYPPLPTKPRQYLHQDTTQRFLNHLVLPKHRTSKFSRLIFGLIISTNRIESYSRSEKRDWCQRVVRHSLPQTTKITLTRHVTSYHRVAIAWQRRCTAIKLPLGNVESRSRRTRTKTLPT
ncbi:hypothetical protein WN51_02627 [Melipona quadrifasciata]|uniref:Uncharacterized protein n=1 Tax=Melipona quadrifasciata TaxID=166423 RepID=A0A0N1ITA9_9HYME|nr:hypothetical protein WN51_02627 [Melipona quadrifasciata]